MTPNTRRLARTRDLVERLIRSWPTAHHHAATIAADGWPLRGDTAGVRATGHTSSVEAAVIARTTGTGSGYRTADLVAEFAVLELQLEATADRMAVICDQLAGPPPPAARCSGGAGLDGALEWGRPDCDNFADGRPSYLGLCIACYNVRRRWFGRRREVAA